MNTYTYRVIQEKLSILWEVTVLLVLKKVFTNKYLILSGYPDTAV